MNKETIDKIISIIDLSFDALFYNMIACEDDIKGIYKDIRKKLKELGDW